MAPPASAWDQHAGAQAGSRAWPESGAWPTAEAPGAYWGQFAYSGLGNSGAAPPVPPAPHYPYPPPHQHQHAPPVHGPSAAGSTDSISVAIGPPQAHATSPSARAAAAGPAPEAAGYAPPHAASGAYRSPSGVSSRSARADDSAARAYQSGRNAPVSGVAALGGAPPSARPDEVTARPRGGGASAEEGGGHDRPSEVKGTPFGPYLLQSELGRGGMGVVYMAYHRELRRHCALKTLVVQAHEADAIARFVREGQSAAKLGKHPHIVQVFDAGVADGVPYIAMEFVVGTPLNKRLEEGALPAHEALELGRKVALALDHAHNCGVIHRDMKPANIILDRAGEPQILDFGLAKDLTRAGSLSAADTILGTPAYMPPEQAQPGVLKADRRSDVYSLGATLYHCLAGVVPFKGDAPVDTLVKVILEDPPSLSARHGIDSDIEAIVERAMEKRPERRYQTALEMADDLSRVLAGEEPRARPTGAAARTLRRLRRNRGAIAFVASLTLVVVGLIGFLLWRTAERGRALVRRSAASQIMAELYGNEGSEVRIAAFERVIAADPTWDRAYFQLSVALIDRALELENEQELMQAHWYRTRAIEAVDRGIERGLGAAGYYQRGNTREEMNWWGPMLEDFRQAAALDPDGSWGARAAAALAVHEERWQEAEELCTRALAIAPDDDLTSWRRAEARRRLSRYEDAYADAVRAVELWDAEPEYHLLAARLALRLGDLARFAEHVTGARAANPNHPLLLATLSGDALLRGDLARATRLADAAVQVDTERPEATDTDRSAAAYVARARVRLAAGNRRGAREDLERAAGLGGTDENPERELALLDEDPGAASGGGGGVDGEALARSSRGALERGDAARALEAARRALGLDPWRVDALEVAARAAALLGRPGEAVDLVVAKSPGALAVKAWALERAGRRGEAAAAAREALRGEEQPPHARRVHARACMEEGQAELALVHLAQVLRRDPLDLEALDIQARALDAIRDREGAELAREQASWLRHEPTDEAATEERTGPR